MVGVSKKSSKKVAAAKPIDRRGETKTHAAIDIGTNSVHLVVARSLPDGGFNVVATNKDSVRLGEAPGPRKELAAAAIERGVEALHRMAGIAASYEAEIVAVATSATREAPNRNEFIDRVRKETGIEIDVISGIEEARLIHLGVLQALPVYRHKMLVIDIGGGSTEFLVADGPKVLDARSQKLGAVRLTEQFFPDGKAGPKAMKRCRQHLTSALVPVSRMLKKVDGDIEVVVGSSGTITAVAAIAAAAKGDSPNDFNAYSFSAEDVEMVIDLLTGTDADDRKEIEGLDPKRIDIILGGAVLLQGIFQAFKIDQMVVSGYALREGVLFDQITSGSKRGGKRLADLRRSNALSTARALDPDVEHAKTASRLALLIFDQTTKLHGLGDEARELLELAAIVHNVGLFISHAAHHRHTYYVVRHAERLGGFTERERELVALIARYHRRSHPKLRHPEYAALSGDDQELVRRAAGILRVAIGLDRSHQGVVDDVKVKMVKKKLVITPLAAEGVDLSLEEYSAQQRSDLLASALDLEVCIGQPD